MYRNLKAGILWNRSENLEMARISQFLSKRASDGCPSSYTTPNGLSFTTDNLCLHNLANSDITNTPASSLQECLGLCSALGSSLCVGVVFNFQGGTCWMKNSSISTQSPTTDNYAHSALADNLNQSPDLSCGFGNGSTQPTKNGMQFGIMRNQNMQLNNYCPLYGPTPNRSSGLCPYHADSLADCMKICSESAPLCKAVAWNPDMQNGYGNCYVKTDVSPANYETAATTPVSHMAVAKALPELDTSCSNGTEGVTSSGRRFEITCDDNRAGNDLVQIHATTMVDCLDACASFGNATLGACVGAMYDPSLNSGWQNCWLKSAAGTRDPIANNNFGLLKGSDSTSSTPPAASSSPDASGSSSGLSGGAIAGIVVAIIAVIALLGGLLWFFKRCRPKQGSPVGFPVEADGEAWDRKEKIDRPLPVEADSNGVTKITSKPQEVDSGFVYEMPTGRQSR